MNITIIANGVFPEREDLLRGLCAADRVVCCDGAFEKYLRWRLSLHEAPRHRVAVVGDGDSLAPQVLQRARESAMAFDYQRVAEQEYNDLTKAVRYALEGDADAPSQGEPVHIDILGATGLREDHTVGNISLLAYYAETFNTPRHPCTFRLRTDCGDFLPVNGKVRIATRAGQQVSFFALSPDKPVTVRGVRWELEQRCVPWWWQATLNEALGESIEVEGQRLLVYLVQVHA